MGSTLTGGAAARTGGSASCQANASVTKLASTTAVYGDTSATLVTEESPVAPDTWYAKSKVAAETIVEVARQIGYRSQASFSMAFKEFFGQLPKDVRRAGIV